MNRDMDLRVREAASQDIVAVARALGMTVVQRGHRTWAQCPWHADESPSLLLGGRYPHACHCFACGQGGDTISLVREVRGCDFRQAVEWLTPYSTPTLSFRAESRNLSPSLVHPLPSVSRRYATDPALLHIDPANSLSMCLWDWFPRQVVDRISQDYCLGQGDPRVSICHTLFPSIDGQGRIHNIKRQVYDIDRSSPRYCHSVRGMTQWTGAWMLPGWDTDVDRCLFGEHLLARHPDRPVALVESPKNAIVGACWMPDTVWVATGCLANLSRRILAPLRGRQVMVCPDRDATPEWKRRLGQWPDIARWQWSAFCHSQAMPDNPKLDIADLILGTKKTSAPQRQGTLGGRGGESLLLSPY